MNMLKKFNAKYLAFIALAVMFVGCAMDSQKWIVDLVAPSFDAATTAVIANAVSGDDAWEKLNMIYASAHALRTLSGGKITSESVKNILDIWLPSKAHWSKYADSISGTYARYFSMLDGDPKLAATYIEQMALGIETAANRSKNKLAQPQ